MDAPHRRIFFWSRHPAIRRRSQDTTLDDIFAQMANDDSLPRDSSRHGEDPPEGDVSLESDGSVESDDSYDSNSPHEDEPSDGVRPLPSHLTSKKKTHTSIDSVFSDVAPMPVLPKPKVLLSSTFSFSTSSEIDVVK